jgi:hypothetical protein
MEIKSLDNPNNVRFEDLLKICTECFGKPRITGSRHIFKTPWEGDPRINQYVYQKFLLGKRGCFV